MTATATHAAASIGSRQLALATVLIAAAGRFADGPLAWLAACLLVGSVALGTLQVLSDDDPATADLGVPIESLIVPSLVAFGTFAAIRVVPIGLLLVVVLGLAAWVMQRVLATEARLLRSRTGPTDGDRTAVLVQVVGVSFVAFVGVAALIPGGLADAVSGPLAAPTGTQLAVLALVDALVAALAGYRAAALRTKNVRDVVWAAVTSGSAVGIAAAAVRAIEVPRLLGPAILIVVFFLWDAIHAGSGSARRDPRRIWEALLLVVLTGVVVGWSLLLRG